MKSMEGHREGAIIKMESLNDIDGSTPGFANQRHGAEIGPKNNGMKLLARAPELTDITPHGISDCDILAIKDVIYVTLVGLCPEALKCIDDSIAILLQHVFVHSCKAQSEVLPALLVL